MGSFNSSKRAIALLCALIMVFSTALAGCSVRKITSKSSSSSASDDSILIGEGSEDEQSTTIVVGDDGNSYIVDSEGESVVYNPTSVIAVQGGNSSSGGSSTTSQTNAPTATTTKTTSTTKSTTKKPSTSEDKETTKASTSDVYNALAIQRKYGFNKLYDSGTRLVNFYLDTIRTYFEYDDKYWLIELWKGEYAMAAVGCEIGFYNVEADEVGNKITGKTYREIYEDKGPEEIAYNSVSDSDAMYTSMKLWQYEKSTDAKPVQKINYTERKCWWAADFATGVLETHSDRSSLIMVGTIKFPNATMRNLFTEQLSEKGFKQVSSGSITSYDKYDVYAVSGNTVTIGWRYHTDDK